MANTPQLRRRQTARSKRKQSTEPQPSDSSTDVPSSRWYAFTQTKFYPIFLSLAAILFGLSSAVSMSSHLAAIILFVFSILAMLFGLLRTFMSILRRPDNTPLPLPSVHKPDGTVRTQQTITIHEHDKDIATYFASEFPALAVAAAWLYAWSGLRPAVVIYAAYILYRFAYHPLFRIHLWKEPYCDEFERPFGGVPLFKEGDEEPVKVVNGDGAFQAALDGAGEGKLVVVDFSAKWCGPCRAIAPVFKQMATQMTDVLFLTVDIDVSQDVASKMEISSVPTFILFKDGERLELLRGATPAKLQAAVQQHKQ